MHENFSNVFIRGSTNFKKSAVCDHAKGKPHEEALNLHFTSKDIPTNERAKFLANSKENNDVVTGISQMNKNDLERTKRKFEVAYFVAKNTLPFTKYQEVLKLEEKHGVDIGKSYRTDMKCAEFVNAIGTEMKDQLAENLLQAKFLGTLSDGSTDSATIEDEVVYATYFDPQPHGKDTVEVKTCFIGLKSLKTASAVGVTEAITESFSALSPEFTIEYLHKKLVGFTSDGASVNRGKQTSVKVLLRELSPWLVFIWCIAHRLELGLSDALKDTIFAKVDEMLLRLFYLYKKAPKKLRELKELHDSYKDGMEFLEGGFKPKKASGTRWIAHKLAAMKTCLDKWGIYIQHLESLVQDKSYPTKDRAKLSGYLKQWSDAKMPFLLALFIDLLEVPSILSKTMQNDDIDVVMAMNALSKTKKRLDLLTNKEFEKLPHVKYLLSKIEHRDDRYFFHDIELKNYDSCMNAVKDQKDELTACVKECIITRLEEEEESKELFASAAKLLNCEAWLRNKVVGGIEVDDVEYADSDIEMLIQRFETPLREAGITASVPDVINQWHSLLEYAREFLSVASTPYLSTWRKIFCSSRRDQWQDFLGLVELLFTIPICNAKLERMFSKLKFVKTVFRCSLNMETLENLLRIVETGPDVAEYNVMPAVEKWILQADRRPKQNDRKKYKERAKIASPIGSLSDSEDGNETDALFSDTEE